MITWIKIKTDMFSDEKIRLIESLPEADAILVIWIKLLTLAGKTNAGGLIFIGEDIVINEEMFSTLFNRPLTVVRLALKTLERFGMIGFNDQGAIYIENWEKHQNINALEKIREQNRLRKRKERDRKKLENNKKDIHILLSDDKDQKCDNVTEQDVVKQQDTEMSQNVTQQNKNKKKNKNKKEEKEKEKTEDLFPAEILSVDGLKDAYQDFLSYRKELKLKPLTQRGINLQVKFLLEQPDPFAVIENSIKNNWQGLFPINRRDNGQQQQLTAEQRHKLEQIKDSYFQDEN